MTDPRTDIRHEFHIEIYQRYGDDYPLSRTVEDYAVATKIYDGWLFYINDGRIDDSVVVVRLAGRVRGHSVWTILAASDDHLGVSEAVPRPSKMQQRITEHLGMFSA